MGPHLYNSLIFRCKKIMIFKNCQFLNKLNSYLIFRLYFYSRTHESSKDPHEQKEKAIAPINIQSRETKLRSISNMKTISKLNMTRKQGSFCQHQLFKIEHSTIRREATDLQKSVSYEILSRMIHTIYIYLINHRTL